MRGYGLVFGAALAALAGCKSDQDFTPDPPDPEPPPSANPLAIVGPGDAVERGVEVTLDGSRSYDVDSPDVALTYAWEVTAAPEGADLTADTELTGAETAAPVFSAEKIGVYILSLDVTDDEGEVSLTPGEVAVEVLPWTDMKIELTWDQQLDLDLHLVKPGGAYAGSGDCHFGNPGPDWGIEGDLSDNPRLDRDDDLSGGPETILLERPEEGRYLVYVTLYNPRQEATPSATPRLRITQGGEPLDGLGADGFAEGPVLNDMGDVWVAGEIDWETRTFRPSFEVSDHLALGGKPYNE